MDTVSRIPAGSRWVAAQQVEAWGYPRRVGYYELELGDWWQEGPGIAIAWYVPLPQLEDVWAVHAIAAPDWRGRVMTRERMERLEAIGWDHGAQKLYSLIPRETPGMRVQAMRRLLRRYGWAEDDYGAFKLRGV